jgi:site-specific DNA-adenine methylase
MCMEVLAHRSHDQPDEYYPEKSKCPRHRAAMPADGGIVVLTSNPHLRPFFGYYGGKWRDTLKHYPNPEHKTIIEPFAGSAGFSIRHASHRVILCEVDPVIAGVWQYLIRVKAKEILSIPDVSPEESVDDLRVCQEAKWLVGFWLNRGAARPRRSPSKWMREGLRPGSFWGDRVRHTIASQVDYIRHWVIYNRSYADVPTPRVATWFVDPPYQAAGRHYRFGSDQINYAALASWCKSRPGQVIVCENTGATWLPFRELGDVKTTRANSRSREVYWLDVFNKERSTRRSPMVGKV